MSIPVLAVLAGLVVGTATVAAVMVLTHHGSAEVVAPGGGGGGNPPPLTYLFKVYDAATGGNEIVQDDSTFYQFGKVQQTYSVTKTIYIEKTGTGNVTVTPAATWAGTAPGTITFDPPSVTVMDSIRLPIAVKFTAGTTTAPPTNVDVTYTGSP